MSIEFAVSSNGRRARPLRIMHVSRAAETLRSFMIPTLQEQIRLGHEVCICTDESTHTEPLRRAGFDVFTHGMRRSLNPLGVASAVLTVRRVLLERRIDAVVCHNPLGAMIGRLAAGLSGTPRVVYFAHGLPFGPGQNPLQWRLRHAAESVFAPQTTAIVTMNDYDERIAKETRMCRDPGRVFRIPGMGVDLARFVPEPVPVLREKLAGELGFAPDSQVILCVARLIPDKGVRELAEAAVRVCKARSDAVILLAGTGPLLEELRRTARARGLEGRFHVLGWRNDVTDLMRSADIFTLPSYYMEGLPVSLLEAMACGKPVVTTRHKGCQDAVVDGETGFLVPVRAIGPLADRLTALLDDAALRARMGLAGRQRVEQHYDLEHCTRAIVEVLEEALAD